MFSGLAAQILGVTLDDFYSFDLTTMAWTSVTLADRQPARRYGAAFAATQGSIYLFGGYGGPGA
jgi:N-acetylneuraminic acid mutarotase